MLTDAVTICGYMLVVAGLLSLLRFAGSVDRNALIDGLIVCLGTAAPAVQYVSIPAATIADRSSITSWLAGLYPVIDIVIIFLVINLAFSTAIRLVSFRLIVLCAVLSLTGDLGYAIIGTTGQLSGPAIMDVPFLLAFTALGAASLHPSARLFPDIVAQPIQPWSVVRLSLIGPALTAPFVVLLAGSGENVGQRTAVVLCGMLTIALVARAITAVHRQAEAQARLLYRATHDQLTGLPNRDRLKATLNEWIAAAGDVGGCWVVYLDLDDFKRVNDHWGHDVGDRYLREVAHQLDEIAGSGTLVARTGGDEFALAHRGDEAGALVTAELVVAVLRSPIRLPELSLVTTASVGVVARECQPSAEEMMRDADVALYRSKDSGRDRATVFRVDMRDSVRHRVEIEQALRLAIANDELWVAYQPLVRLDNERVVGAEALVRWCSPELGEISPGVFIPIAEDSGLVQEIGEFVLGRALQQLSAWRADGLVHDDFSVSVNVSAHQLSDRRLPLVVRSALEVAGLPAQCLTIELTESTLMADHEGSTDLLRQVRALGVGLAMDDFGTGYSSLSYLGALPITAVKIDKSFVDGLGHRDHEEAINRAIVAMADSLHLEVTAEGIETATQLEILRRLGISRGQGWYWGKAVEATQFRVKHLHGSGSIPVPAARRPSTPERRDAPVGFRD